MHAPTSSYLWLCDLTIDKDVDRHGEISPRAHAMFETLSGFRYDSFHRFADFALQS